MNSESGRTSYSAPLSAFLAGGVLKALLVAVLWLAAAAWPAARPLAAQEPADTFELPDLVVTATRLPVPAEAVPTPVAVLEGEELRQRGIRRVSDAVAGLPGLNVLESGSWGGTTSLFVRGGESDYVQVLVDGVPINQPGGAVDLANLSTDNVERIEVVRGPASVLYGSDAVSGVVQIFTREGGGQPRVNGRLRAGSHGTTDLQAGLTGSAGRGGYAVSVSRFSTDGAYAFNNDHRNTVASALVHLRPDNATELRLSARYTDNDFHFPTDGSGNLVDRNAFQFGESTTLSLRASRFLLDRVEGVLLLSSHGSDGGVNDEFDDDDDDSAFRSLNEVTRRSVDARANFHVAEDAVLTLGGAFDHDRERSFNESVSEFGTSTGSTDLARSNRALYGQALVPVGGRVSLTGGARLEDNEAFGRFATYRGGAVVTLTRGLRLRSVLGTGFKAPTFLENYATGFVTGNPELEPEESRSWEGGIDAHLLNERVLLSATYFDQRFTNLIDFTFTPPEEGDPNYFNVIGATSSGVELSADAELRRGLSAAASYTYLDTEVVEPGFATGDDATFAAGAPLLRRPRHSASLRIRFAPEGAGAFSLEARRIGAREDIDFSVPERLELPAVVVVDASAEYPLIGGSPDRAGLTATLRVENVLDEEYQNPVNFPARGRTLLMGVRAGMGL